MRILFFWCYEKKLVWYDVLQLANFRLYILISLTRVIECILELFFWGEIIITTTHIVEICAWRKLKLTCKGQQAAHAWHQRGDISLNIAPSLYIASRQQLAATLNVINVKVTLHKNTRLSLFILKKILFSCVSSKQIGFWRMVYVSLFSKVLCCFRELGGGQWVHREDESGPSFPAPERASSYLFMTLFYFLVWKASWAAGSIG